MGIDPSGYRQVEDAYGSKIQMPPRPKPVKPTPRPPIRKPSHKSDPEPWSSRNFLYNANGKVARNTDSGNGNGSSGRNNNPDPREIGDPDAVLHLPQTESPFVRPEGEWYCQY